MTLWTLIPNKVSLSLSFSIRYRRSINPHLSLPPPLAISNWLYNSIQSLHGSCRFMVPFGPSSSPLVYPLALWLANSSSYDASIPAQSLVPPHLAL